MSGYFILKGILINTSPLSIGNGQAESTDRDVIRDSQGQPFIPGTTLAGALRYLTLSLKHEYETLWGLSHPKGSKEGLEKNEVQSCTESYVRIFDANKQKSTEQNPEKQKDDVSVRHGVALNEHRHVQQESGYGQLYNYEVLGRGVKFDFWLEIPWSKLQQTKGQEAVNAKSAVLELCKHIAVLLQQGIQIGHGSSKGLGQIRFEDWTLYCLDFSKPKHLHSWLDQEPDTWPQDAIYSSCNSPCQLPEIKSTKGLRIQATLALKSSLLIRDPGLPGDEADSQQLQDQDKYVIPGSSIKGALRAQAKRILTQYLNKDKDTVDLLLNIIFGSPDQRAALQLNEVVLEHVVSKIQDRIQLDRFSGVVLQKFNSSPVFRHGEQPSESQQAQVKLEWTWPDFKTDEPLQKACAGLVLLCLRDLFEGQLAIGGEISIGRGVMQGIEAQVTWTSEHEAQVTCTLNQDFKVPEQQNNNVYFKALKQWVSELQTYKYSEEIKKNDRKLVNTPSHNYQKKFESLYEIPKTTNSSILLNKKRQSKKNQKHFTTLNKIYSKEKCFFCLTNLDQIEKFLNAQQNLTTWVWYTQKTETKTWSVIKDELQKYLTTLQEARLFNQDFEAYIWRDFKGILQARLRWDQTFKPEDNESMTQSEFIETWVVDSDHRMDGSAENNIWTSTRNYITYTEEGLAYYVDQRWLKRGAIHG